MHWIVPTLAGVFLSTFMMLIFVAYLNYLVDVYTMYAASAVAANTILRSAVGAAAPLFTNRMFDRLGVGPGGSLVGGVAVLLAVIPFAFHRWGERIRARSRFAAASAGKPPGAAVGGDDEEKQAGGGDETGSGGVLTDGNNGDERHHGIARDVEKDEEKRRTDPPSSDEEESPTTPVRIKGKGEDIRP